MSSEGAKRLLTALTVPLQRGSTRKKWPGVVVVAGYGSGAGRRKRSHCLGAPSSSKRTRNWELRREAPNTSAVGQDDSVDNRQDEMDVRRYTVHKQQQCLAATRIALSYRAGQPRRTTCLGGQALHHHRCAHCRIVGCGCSNSPAGNCRRTRGDRAICRRREFSVVWRASAHCGHSGTHSSSQPLCHRRSTPR